VTARRSRLGGEDVVLSLLRTAVLAMLVVSLGDTGNHLEAFRMAVAGAAVWVVYLVAIGFLSRRETSAVAFGDPAASPFRRGRRPALVATLRLEFSSPLLALSTTVAAGLIAVLVAVAITGPTAGIWLPRLDVEVRAFEILAFPVVVAVLGAVSGRRSVGSVVVASVGAGLACAWASTVVDAAANQPNTYAFWVVLTSLAGLAWVTELGVRARRGLSRATGWLVAQD
jgi:hypothetical protein